MKRTWLIPTLIGVSIAALAGTGRAEVLASWDFTAATNQLADNTGHGYDLTNVANGSSQTVLFDSTDGARFDNSGRHLTYDYAALNPSTIGAGETWILRLNGVRFNSDPTATAYQVPWGNRTGDNGIWIYKFKNYDMTANHWMLWAHDGTAFRAVSAAAPNTEPTTSTTDTYDFEIQYDGAEFTFGVWSSASGQWSHSTLAVSKADLNLDGDKVNFGMNDYYPTLGLDGSIRSASIEVISYDPDLDNDGLPDAWEITYGLDPLDDGSVDPDNGPDGDPDQDGMPNSEELHLESSPIDPLDPDADLTHQWETRPEKAHLLAFSGHADDESIFFGGLLPYTTQVRRLNTLLVCLAMGKEVDREDGMRRAAWNYGLRYAPIYPRMPAQSGLPRDDVNSAWNAWDGDKTDGLVDLNGNGIPDGREAGARVVARLIRLYRPEVVATHDLDGEYGHGGHQATGWAAVDAYALAADTNVDIDGLPAWQVKKLYIHQSNSPTNPFGSTGVTFQNFLFHDYWEDVTIDTTGNGSPDSTPREVANDGLDSYSTALGAKYDVCSVYSTAGEYNNPRVNYSGTGLGIHDSEYWALHSSTVGPDTIVAPFTIIGNPDTLSFTDWARGDMFENLTVFPDRDSDTLPDDWELARFASLATADPQADDDHDGLDNRYEFVAGLDPHTPDRSEFAIAADAASVDFSVPGTAGVIGYEGLTRRYQIIHSPDLADWSTVVAEGVADDGMPLSYLIGDAGESGDRGFYRLVLTIE